MNIYTIWLYVFKYSQNIMDQQNKSSAIIIIQREIIIIISIYYNLAIYPLSYLHEIKCYASS